MTVQTAQPIISTGRPGAARAVLVAIAGAASGLLLAGVIITILATQFFGFRVLTVSSESMSPALRKGDVVVMRPVEKKNIERGDVVVYGGNGDVSIAHRVIAINTINATLVDSKTGESDTATTYQFVTKGDANPAPDGAPIDQSRVEGRVWFTVPFLSGDVGGLSLQWLFGSVAVVLAASWLAWEGYRLFLRRRAGPGA